MKINHEKFQLAQARACMGQKELEAAGIPKGTLSQACKRNVRPDTAGRIAAALGCDVLDIIEIGDNEEVKRN